MHGTTLERRGKSGKMNFMVSGGACGVVIDARGRPLNLPVDEQKRREILTHWQSAIKDAHTAPARSNGGLKVAR